MSYLFVREVCCGDRIERVELLFVTGTIGNRIDGREYGFVLVIKRMILQYGLRSRTLTI